MAIMIEYVVIAYAVAYTAKVAGVKKKWLPVIAACAGLICAVVSKVIYPDLTQSWFDSIAMGIFSGFSATGTNEIAKYIFMRKEED